MSNAELACSYASLILADEGIEITVCIPSFIPLGPEDDGGIFGRLEMLRKRRGMKSGAQRWNWSFGGCNIGRETEG